MLASLRYLVADAPFLRFAPHFVWHQSQEEKFHLIFVLVVLILIILVGCNYFDSDYDNSGYPDFS